MPDFAQMDDPGWMLQQLSKEYSRHALRIAEQLRQAADTVERRATSISIDKTTGLPDHNRSAADILSEINAFHGHLSTSNLLTAAADADLRPQPGRSLMGPDLLAHATEFEFYPEGATFGDHEVHCFAVRVTRRSNDLWAVVWMNQCWNKRTLDWEYEPRDRSKQFLRECRLPFDEAIRTARSKPDTLSVNGKTWADFKAIHAMQDRSS